MKCVLNKKNIRWGIIGLGHIAQKFAKDLAKVPDAELYAVASRSETKATEFANQYQAHKAYSSYESLVKDADVDAIYIATPHSFHKAHTMLCLENQKPVLCEKPFAMNLEEVTAMIATAKENNVLLMEALWTFFLPHYQHVLALIQQEKLGKVLRLEADFGFQPPHNLDSRVLNKNLGGGSLLDIGIYPVFAALSILGDPQEIVADATFFENGSDASCDIAFHYKNAKAFLKCTFLEETPTEAIITCEKGIIKIPTRFHEARTVSLLQNGKEETFDFSRTTLGYNYEIIHFQKLLRAGKKESNLMTFDFSKCLIQTLDTIRNRIGLKY